MALARSSLRRALSLCHNPRVFCPNFDLPNCLVKIRGLSSVGSMIPPFAQFLPMPALSPTMTAGSVTVWHVTEGSAFEAGDVICEVETDKATVDYEAVDAGVLAKILVGDKTSGAVDIQVGEPIAILVEDKSDLEKLISENLDFLKIAGHTPKEDSTAVSDQEKEEVKQLSVDTNPVTLSPAARHILETHGIDPSTVEGSGRRGMITKGDALQAIQGASARGASLVANEISYNSTSGTATTESKPDDAEICKEMIENVSDVSVSTMRKVIATRLTESKHELPHYYATIECEIDELLELRKFYKRELNRAPSLNDMIIRASALALRDVPILKSQLSADGKVVEQEQTDISVAVATSEGLITPIITNADKKGFMEISDNVRDLASRAKTNKLKLEEFQGGCFTISNLGMFGVNDFTAVINLPQVAILAVGSGAERVKISHREQENGFILTHVDEDQLESVSVMSVSLSADRRIVDDASAAQFLQSFKTYVSNPKLMNL